MATNISIKLDVTKINKEKLFKGEKGTYLDATIIMKDEPDQYGNIGMVVQNSTKEERDAGVKSAILGNVKYFGNYTKATENNIPTVDAPEISDLPF
jgi:hypothetical protein